jgi:D-alanine--poly(phosphoribitol) ligase subunit 2
MREKIEDYLTGSFIFEFNDEITEETDLFKTGIIDSFGYMKMLQFLEAEFQITLTDDELFSNVLVSLSNIVNFVDQKKNCSKLN